MILKRPYAFLIKYFKVINFALALLFIYIAYKSYNVMVFFNDYISNNYSGNFYSNFYVEYLSPIVTLALLLIIVLLAAVLWLLIFKKKPVKIYVASIVYYIIIFVFFKIVKNMMINMETNVITAEVSRIYRDMSLIFLVPQLIFVITFIVRGLGLNLDKFHFEKDIKELEVSSEDNEEVELTFKNDTVKLKRGFKRYFREFKYYLLENKLIVSILGVVIGILLIVFIISLFPKKVDNNYKQGNSFFYNNITYTIKDSIITNMNYNGDIINQNKYYVVILLNITNDNNSDRQIDFNNFRLILKDSSIYPIMDKGLYFVDYAKDYSGTVIKGNSNIDYSLVFEINKEEIKKNYVIKFMAGSKVVDNEIIGKYNNTVITPSLIDKVTTIKTYSLGEEVTLLNTNLGNTKVSFNNYLTTRKYTYDYENCYNSNCSTYKDIVNLDYTKNDKTLLVLDYTYSLDESIPFANTSKTISGFDNYFVKVKYLKGEEYVYGKVKDVSPSRLKNKVVLEVTREIETSESLYLSIVIRNKEYLITIK